MRKLLNSELGRISAGEADGAPKIPVVVILDNVRSLGNVGAFFRTGDAFGIEKIVLCGITGTPPDRELHKTALGAEVTVPWEYALDTSAAVDALHNEGYTVLAIEQVEEATGLENFTVTAGVRYALVFGNEVDGVAQSVVDHCDGAIEIPQIGTKHSLNVSVSGGVVLWAFFSQYR
jgi:tRNA G18 (ribose-2'-O)-methylase SpoU